MIRNAILPVLIIALVSPAFAAPAVAPGDASWQEKLDAPLAKALDGDPEWARHADEDGRFVVIAMLPAHAPPESRPESRAAWRAYWEAEAAPHVAAVTTVAESLDAPVRSVWPVVPAVAVALKADEVPVVAALDVVESLILDYEGAVHLHDPVDEAPAAPDWHNPDPTAPGDRIPEMGATGAWSTGFRGENVLVAIVDSGVQPDHPMLLHPDSCKERLVGWFDAVNHKPEAYDDHGHGTHVAGTVLGTTGCGGRVNGIAPYAGMLAAKMLGSNGKGTQGQAGDALNWAFDHGAHIAQNSWSGSCSGGSSGFLVDFASRLAEAGMLMVFSAGNEGPSAMSMQCPAAADPVISVGAVTRSKSVASFSSRGPCNDWRTCPDVTAVGVSVLSSVPGNWYGYKSGTSMAAPHVSGAAALLTQAADVLLERDLAPAGADGDAWSEVEQLMKAHAEDLAAPGPDNDTGWGYVQIGDILDGFLGDADPAARITVEALNDTVYGPHDMDVTFRLWNLADADLTDGTVTIRLDDEVVLEEDLTLAQGAMSRYAFTYAASDLPLGDHALNVTYAFTDPDGTPRTLTGSHAFHVQDLDVRATADYPDVVLPGEPFDVVVNVTNHGGNVAATDTTFTLTVPREYQFVYRVPLDGKLNSLWSTPAADGRSSAVGGAVTLRFDVGDLAPGASWEAAYTLVARDVGVHEQDFELTYGIGDSLWWSEEAADAWPQSVRVVPE